MIPITSLNNDLLNNYVDTLSNELRVAYARGSAPRELRRMTARLLVRVGAWMLPDKPAMVSDTIIVLPKQDSVQPDVRTAA